MALTTLDPRTALVVIDLQNGLAGLDTKPHPVSEVIRRSAELADAFRARDLPVVLVRVSFHATGADATPGRTETPGRSGGLPEGFDQIVPELAGHDGDIIVTKRNWGAFHGTDLDLQLRRRRVTQIVLTGVATSAGVESSARSAHEHGYHVTLVADAMADRDTDMHDHRVGRIFPRIGETGMTTDVLTLLDATARNP